MQIDLSGERTVQMARGKFNFLNIAKLTEEEITHLRETCPMAELEGPVYGNHSGEWFARKTGKYTYTVVSFATLATEGWKCEGIACTLRGVRQVIEILYQEKEAHRKANWMWC